jgi:hypothetical protein
MGRCSCVTRILTRAWQLGKCLSRGWLTWLRRALEGGSLMFVIVVWGARPRAMWFTSLWKSPSRCE